MSTSAETVPELVYAVSHDIGEPIREILGFAQLIAQHTPDDVSHKFWEDLGHVESGALRARAMLGALCDFIQVEDLEPEARQVDLAELCRDVVAETDAIRVAFPAHLETNVEGVVASYPDVLRDVLIELVKNAVRFGVSEGDHRADITITAVVGSAHIEIAVEDNGPGIPVALIDRAPQLFQRLHRRTQHDTLGAGLAIARRKLERCGGALELNPGSTGGLRVTAQLPIPVIDLRARETALDLPLAS